MERSHLVGSFRWGSSGWSGSNHRRGLGTADDARPIHDAAGEAMATGGSLAGVSPAFETGEGSTDASSGQTARMRRWGGDGVIREPAGGGKGRRPGAVPAPASPSSDLSGSSTPEVHEVAKLQSKYVPRPYSEETSSNG